MRGADFSFEKKLHKQGYKIIAGVDEVGRGCFAGAVVAGCVTFKGFSFQGESLINDSKKLSAKQREIADKWIRQNALAFGIGSASVSQVNKLGIKKATEIAFRKAILATNKNLESGSLSKFTSIDYLLIDAFYIPFVRGLRRKNQMPIVKGDSKSFSIASASIIAKVYRDKLMVSLSKQSKYKKYKWGQNKGYGTKEHRDLIRKHGTSNQHRKAFVNTWLENSKV